MSNPTPWINEDGSLNAGIYYGISDADYQRLDALRASTMKEALQSAHQLRYRMSTPRADTGSLRLGRAVHLAVLQHDVYAAETAEIPAEYITGSGTLSTAKKARDWMAEQSPDVTMMTQAERADVDGMASAVASHGPAAEMLRKCCGREVTAIWYETTPMGVRVACKARADAIGGGILADLKSMGGRKKFDPRGIASTIAEYGYAYQMGWYERGLIAAGGDDFTSLDWGWVFVQSSAPYDVIAAVADDQMQDLGRWWAQSVWETYASALDSGEWPGVAPELMTVSLPRWAVPVDNEDSEDYLEGL